MLAKLIAMETKMAAPTITRTLAIRAPPQRDGPFIAMERSAEPFVEDGTRVFLRNRRNARECFAPAERLARVDDHLGVRSLAALALRGHQPGIERRAPRIAHDIDLFRRLTACCDRPHDIGEI